MKKAFISAAAFAVVAVSSIAIAPTTSEAIPAFARQTGAACLSCHFQTFPALNAFGRAFKIGAFTDVGDQALIEDDNMSLPAVLNLGMVLRPVYEHSRATTGGRGAKTNTNMTTWSVPADSNLLVAGRVGTNTGAFVEFNAGAGNFQLMNSFDFDSFKAGLNINASGFGPTAALELTSVYGQHSGKLFGGDVSAINNIIPQANTSVALWASNGMFTLQVAGVVAGVKVTNNRDNAAQVTNNSFVPMVALTVDTEVGGFAAVIELGTMNGTQTATGLNTTTLVTAASTAVKATWLAAQIQGELGDMSLGIYADYATTKSGDSTRTNVGNLATNGRQNYAFALNGMTYGGINDGKIDGYSIRAEIEPMHQLMFGVGFGTMKATSNASGAAGSGVHKSTYVHYAATYEIYQNMEVTLSQTNTSISASGTAGTAGLNTSLAGVDGDLTKATRIEIEAVF